MARSRLLLPVALASILAGCSTTVPDVAAWSLQSPELGLPKSKTYAWTAGGHPVHDSTGVWGPAQLDLDPILRSLIDGALGERGYSAAGEPAWLEVSYEILADVDQVAAARSRLANLATAKPVEVGSLVVDLVDHESGRVLWRGAAVGAVAGHRKDEQIHERLAYAVREIFDGFPE